MDSADDYEEDDGIGILASSGAQGPGGREESEEQSPPPPPLPQSAHDDPLQMDSQGPDDSETGGGGGHEMPQIEGIQEADQFGDGGAVGSKPLSASSTLNVNPASFSTAEGLDQHPGYPDDDTVIVAADYSDQVSCPPNSPATHDKGMEEEGQELVEALASEEPATSQVYVNHPNDSGSNGTREEAARVEDPAEAKSLDEDHAMPSLMEEQGHETEERLGLDEAIATPNLSPPSASSSEEIDEEGKKTRRRGPQRASRPKTSQYQASRKRARVSPPSSSVGESKGKGRARSSGQPDGKSMAVTSKHPGVHFVKQMPARSRWRAQIKVNGRYYHVGFSRTPEEAVAAYKNAVRIYHGKGSDECDLPEEGGVDVGQKRKRAELADEEEEEEDPLVMEALHLTDRDVEKHEVALAALRQLVKDADDPLYKDKDEILALKILRADLGSRQACEAFQHMLEGMDLPLELESRKKGADVWFYHKPTIKTIEIPETFSCEEILKDPFSKEAFKEVAAARAFLDEWGYVIFRDATTKLLAKMHRDDVRRWMERTRKGFVFSDPTTWDNFFLEEDKKKSKSLGVFKESGEEGGKDTA